MQKQISDALELAFKNLRPADLDQVYNSTQGYSKLEWRRFQLTAAVVGGAAGAAIPGAHLAGLAADLVHLLYRMQLSSLGVGAIEGRSRYQTNILADEDFSAVLAQWSDPDIVVELAQIKLEAVVGKANAKVIAKLAAKAIAKKLGLLTAGQLSQKVMAKVIAKLLGKLAGKGVFGFVPIFGALISGAINAWFMHQIAEAADAYFPKKCALISQYT